MTLICISLTVACLGGWLYKSCSVWGSGRCKVLWPQPHTSVSCFHDSPRLARKALECHVSFSAVCPFREKSFSCVFEAVWSYTSSMYRRTSVPHGRNPCRLVFGVWCRIRVWSDEIPCDPSARQMLRLCLLLRLPGFFRFVDKQLLLLLLLPRRTLLR